MLKNIINESISYFEMNRNNFVQNKEIGKKVLLYNKKESYYSINNKNYSAIVL